MNAYSTLYALLFRVRNVTRRIAKLAAWITGLPAAIVAVWASGLGKPLADSIGTGNPFALHFAVCFGAFIILPRLFDFAMRRVAALFEKTRT